jgi:shikimate kinase
MNITLVGMPGAGKSHIGRMLAKRLGRTCLETDEALVKEYRLPLPKIVEKLGDKKFLQKEAEVIISHTRGKDDLVISPGGSIVYQSGAMKHLKKISRIVYLQVPLEILEKRIGSVPRGIIGAKHRKFSEIYRGRLPLYEKYADFTIDGTIGAKNIVSEILRTLQKSE